MAEVIKKALANYLRVHGRRLYSIAQVTGQDYIDIEVSALYRYHEPTERYPKIMIAINEVLNSGGKIDEELILVKRNDEVYIRIPIRKIPEYFE